MIIKFIILTFLVQNSFGLQHFDHSFFCRTQKEQYDRNNGDHLNKCGKNLCSKNNLECKEYLAQEKLTKSIHENNNNLSLLSNTSMLVKRFVNLADTIEIWKNSIISKANDFCLNPGGCFLRKEKTRPISRLNSFASIPKTYIFKTVECPCHGVYSYKCHKNLCSKSKIKCEILIQNKYQLDSQFKNCGILIYLLNILINIL